MFIHLFVFCYFLLVWCFVLFYIIINAPHTHTNTHTNPHTRIHATDGNNINNIDRNIISDKICQMDEWQCASSECINSKYVCDDHYDCQDRSDEWPDSCKGQGNKYSIQFIKSQSTNPNQPQFKLTQTNSNRSHHQNYQVLYLNLFTLISCKSNDPILDI